jgi:signal peptidase I
MTDKNENYDNTEEFQPRKNTIMHEIFDWAKHIVIAIMIGLILVLFVVQRNEVKGPSMQPTLYQNDQLLVQKISKLYKGGITYGDIITIEADGLYGISEDKNIIKRVIGLPGDQIEIKNGMVYRNGTPVVEEYLGDVLTMEKNEQYSNVILDTDEYYVMGDNREISLDSRYFGVINQSRIVGEVLIRFYPFKSLGKP